jgi:hypothetical protein
MQRKEEQAMTTYRNMTAVAQALNDGAVILPEDVAPALLDKPIWVGYVSPEGGYLPNTWLFGTCRADVAAGLREYGARGLGRRGPGCDYRHGMVYELERHTLRSIL